MTESLSYDKNAVAERAYLMDGSPVWKVDGNELTGDTVTVDAGGVVKIECTLTLSPEDREYLKVFTNGMFVEGFRINPRCPVYSPTWSVFQALPSLLL